MKNRTRFRSTIGVALIAMVLAVYYLIPGITHPRPMGGATTDPAIGMAVVLLSIALIAGIVA
jgi:hypothetical protein